MIGLATIETQIGQPTKATATFHQAETAMQLTHPTLSSLARAELQKLRQGTAKPTTAASGG